MSAATRIGIDLGGTKIAAIALDGEDNVLAEKRIATPREDYHGTIEAIAHLVDDLQKMVGKQGSIGMGMPGSISPATGFVQNANSTWLNGRALHKDLSARLSRPIRLANDANCFALSEAIDGAGSGANSVFGVILGTGCGGGLVVNEKIINGPRGIGGEWGHNSLPWPKPDELPGPNCWCGRYGCMESWVSGPALAKDYCGQTGEIASAEDIAAKAQLGEKEAQKALDRHASRLARGLAMVINIFDPEVIVLGGGLSQLSHLYQDLPKRISPHIFADHDHVIIRPPEHGDASGVRGAARLWDETRLDTSKNHPPPLPSA